MASFFLTSFAQDPLSDTIKKLDSLSTIKKEQNPNYFGFNITSLMSGIITTTNDYNVKVGAVYKHNFGYKNIDFGFPICVPDKIRFGMCLSFTNSEKEPLREFGKIHASIVVGRYFSTHKKVSII